MKSGQIYFKIWTNIYFEIWSNIFWNSTNIFWNSTNIFWNSTNIFLNLEKYILQSCWWWRQQHECPPPFQTTCWRAYTRLHSQPPIVRKYSSKFTKIFLKVHQNIKEKWENMTTPCTIQLSLIHVYQSKPEKMWTSPKLNKKSIF